MNRFRKLVVALIALPSLVGIAIGATSFMGASVNIAQIGGSALAFGQAAMAASIPVALASNQSALAVTGTFWQATQPISMAASSAPTIAKVGATTSSASLIASNATRKGIEVDTDCANTDSVAINFGASAAVYASHKQMAPCTSWTPPATVVPTSAIQVISNSGTQQVRVIEYP